MHKIWIVVITFLFTAAIAGGGTYYCMNKRAQDEKNDLQAQIGDLDTKYNQVKEELTLSQSKKTDTAESQTSIAASTTTTSNTSQATLNKDIEKINFSNAISVNTKIGDELQAPQYADLNGDNSEEAVVVYLYSGTAAEIDFYIYSVKNDSVVQLYKKQGLKSGGVSIKSNVVYVDYCDPNSAVNRDLPESDQQIDIHKKYTWNGATFVESNQ